MMVDYKGNLYGKVNGKYFVVDHTDKLYSKLDVISIIKKYQSSKVKNFDKWIEANLNKL